MSNTADAGRILMNNPSPTRASFDSQAYRKNSVWPDSISREFIRGASTEQFQSIRRRTPERHERHAGREHQCRSQFLGSEHRNSRRACRSFGDLRYGCSSRPLRIGTTSGLSIRRSEVLYSRPHYDLIDINISRLLDCIGDGASDGISRNCKLFVKLLHRFCRCFVGSAFLQFRVDRTGGDDRSSDSGSMDLQSQAFAESANR